MTEEGAPAWAVEVIKDVAEIRGLTAQLPFIVTKLEELRAESVPMREHLALLKDVEELKERDLGARSDWEQMRIQVPTLWREYDRRQGRQLALLAWRSVITLGVAILSLLVAAKAAGIKISFG